MSPTNLHWIDWTRPALPGVVQWLVARYQRGACLDLSTVVVVTPGHRSRQRLVELLLEYAAENRIDWIPPEWESVGRLPDRLYPNRKPFASELMQLTAWVRAMQSCDPAELGFLSAGNSSPRPVEDWHPLAHLLQRLHRDLAAEAISFSDVVDRIRAGRVDAELPRWQVLDRLQRAYYDQLDAVEVWDPQAARLFALRHRLCATESEIVLVGAADLNQLLRQMLHQVRAQVHPLVFAAAEDLELFDDLGCLLTEPWQTRSVELIDSQIRFADRPQDQIAGVIDILAQQSPAPAASDIAIVVPDVSMVPQIQRELGLAGVDSRSLAGRPLETTRPFRLIAAVADYLESHRFDDFAALVRHPDLFELLSRQLPGQSWLYQLDVYQNEAISATFALDRPLPKTRDSDVNPLRLAMRDLLAELRIPAQSLQAMGAAWNRLLIEVYGGQTLDMEHEENQELVFAVRELQSGLAELEEIPAGWETAISATDAVRLVCHQMRGVPFVPGVRPQAVELIGWLDLPLDDAALAIVTQLNDGYIPSSENAGPFLSNGLCAQLGIVDNARRYARDAYYLSFLCQSPRKSWLISGRRDGQGNPLLPSRLLFSASDDSLVGRARAFFGHRGESGSEIWLTSSKRHPRSQQLVVPPPDPQWTRVESLSVTDFRSYLECPYRFYLNQVLQLKGMADDFEEMPAFVFGHVVHDVLKLFAESDVRDSTSPDEIRAFCRSQIPVVMARRFGDSPVAAIRIQFEQLRMRLDQWAEVQAKHRDQGWRIVAAEMKDAACMLDVDGQPFQIIGRIDRIDQCETTGRFAIFDYKTGERALTPEDAHRDAKGWKDLQLPLYCHLARSLGWVSDHPYRLGYVNIPQRLSDVKIEDASWTAADLAAADAVAADVIRAVRAARFWPPAESPRYASFWARICQDEVFEKHPVGEPKLAGDQRSTGESHRPAGPSKRTEHGHAQH